MNEPAIVATGSALPPKLRKNTDPIFTWLNAHKDAEELFKGYEERRVLDTGESITDYAVRAGATALAQAGIAAGDVEVAILAGAEAFRSYMRARKLEVPLDWPKADDNDVPLRLGEELNMNHPAEIERKIVAPVQIYPMFETALRAAAGRTVAEHQAFLGRLWSDLSNVAAGNPNAWIRDPKSPEEITTVGPHNRMIGLPYPKMMNSNSDVDMGASIIMCSVDAAQRMGISEDRWVFPLSGSDCHEHNFVSHRDAFVRTPAIEIGGRRALEMAGLTIDEVELIDLYSCFPSAVQLGAQSLGINPLERQWSRTGGLPFAGGPWNNYAMHAIATMVGELRERPGAHGLVWANGGYATKHAFGVYSTTPPGEGFGYDHPQAQIDALPKRELATGTEAAGAATIEAYSVMFARDGSAERALASCLLSDGRRAWGSSTDPAIGTAMCDGEWVGINVTIDADGSFHL